MSKDLGVTTSGVGEYVGTFKCHEDFGSVVSKATCSSMNVTKE